MADIYWPGTEVPIGQIKPYLHRFLDEYSGGRIHCAYAQPFRPEYTQVDYLFRLIYVFEGRFITSAPFDGRIEDREIVGGECFVGGRAHWDHVDLAHCCCKAISIIFTRYHIRLLYSEFRNGEVLQQPYSHLQYESPVLKKMADAVDAVLLNRIASQPAASVSRSLPLLLQATILELLREIDRLSLPQSSQYPQILKRVLFYMQVNFSANISCSSICSELQVNRTYISTLFHRFVGMEMKSYLLKLRMEKSLQLLRHYPMSIDEVAAQCGFSSSKYFIACFKRFYGGSPGSFRKAARLAEESPRDAKGVFGEFWKNREFF